ncbi:MAG: GntR family transcriptional regulator [Anaerolineaceae bacterium]|nr:GntR family transcriptional regulator [Anaerolineaceae bacterium]
MKQNKLMITPQKSVAKNNVFLYNMKSNFRSQTTIIRGEMKLIDRNRPYTQQVKEILRDWITDLKYGTDGKIPSEAELSTELGVSRATVRSALTILASEGKIIRLHGEGTYVNKRLFDLCTRPDIGWDAYRKIQNTGHTATINLIKIENRKARRSEITALELQEEEEVVSVSRIFKSDQIPVMYSLNVIPKQIICEEYQENIFERPILDFLAECCGKQFGYAISDFEACLAVEDFSLQLQIEDGTPILKIRDILFGIRNEPLVYGMNFYNHNILCLRIVRSEP